MANKRWRAVTAKDNQIKVAFGREPHCNPELIYSWGNGPGGSKGAVSMIMYHWNHLKNGEGKSFIQELEERGYDLTTLKFTIERKK